MAVVPTDRGTRGPRGLRPASHAGLPAPHQTAPEATAVGGEADRWGPRPGADAGCRRRLGTAAGGPAGPGARPAALGGRASPVRRRTGLRCAWRDGVDGSSANLTRGPGAGPGGWGG